LCGFLGGHNLFALQEGGLPEPKQPTAPGVSKYALGGKTQVISVSVVDEQSYVRLPRRRIVQAVRTALESAGLRRARMTVALIDDQRIRQLNRQFLQEDEPTDVLSFPMGRTGQGGLEGEIVVSAQRAAATAAQYGWKPEDELLLYIIHGALHLAGFDDTTAAKRQRMRRQEALCLERLGVRQPTLPAPHRRPTEPLKSPSATKGRKTPLRRRSERSSDADG